MGDVKYGALMSRKLWDRMVHLGRRRQKDYAGQSLQMFSQVSLLLLADCKYRIAPEFDIWPQIAGSSYPVVGEVRMPRRTSFHDMYKARLHSRHSGLVKFIDKLKLKRLLKKAGLPTMPLRYASRSPVHIANVLRNKSLRRYVVKPTHRDGSTGVFTVRDGYDLRSAKAVTPEFIQFEISRVWNKSNLTSDEKRRWRGYADEAAVPGVIIEDLALNVHGKHEYPMGYRELSLEVSCFVVFGSVTHCTTAVTTPTENGAVKADYGDLWPDDDEGDSFCCVYCRQGWVDAGHYYPEWDFTTWKDNAPGLFTKFRVLSERFARTFRVDFIRVDILHNGGNPVIMEVALTPANLGTQKHGLTDGFAKQVMAQKWLHGYGRSAKLPVSLNATLEF